MRIEFDPTNRDEATAVRAILDVMNPNGWTGKTLTARFEEPTEEKVHSEDGGMTVNLTDGTITVASDTTAVPETDANGEPWDARIHSTPAKTNADGTWRAKRGVKAEEIAAVRAEREAQTPAYPTPSEDAPYYGAEPAPAQEIPTAEDPNDPKHLVADPIVTAPPAPPAPTGQSEAPLAPAASSATTQEEQNTDLATSAAPVSFLDVMKAITAAQKDGHVTTAKVKELCAAIGAGDSTMGLNGADKGELRVQFMALLDGEVGQ